MLIAPRFHPDREPVGPSVVSQRPTVPTFHCWADSVLRLAQLLTSWALIDMGPRRFPLSHGASTSNTHVKTSLIWKDECWWNSHTCIDGTWRLGLFACVHIHEHLIFQVTGKFHANWVVKCLKKSFNYPHMTSKCIESILRLFEITFCCFPRSC